MKPDVKDSKAKRPSRHTGSHVRSRSDQTMVARGFSPWTGCEFLERRAATLVENLRKPWAEAHAYLLCVAPRHMSLFTFLAACFWSREFVTAGRNP